jgi:hypothetical protein
MRGCCAFPLTRELSAGWIEYQIGGNTLALSRPGRTAKDAPTPTGSASLQLAFKVAVDDVDRCADELVRHGVDLLEPPTNQPFGHRTLFFRDPTETCWRCMRRFDAGSPHPEEPASRRREDEWPSRASWSRLR